MSPVMKIASMLAILWLRIILKLGTVWQESRQFYIGVNRKYPGSLDHVFLRDEVTQAQNWGTVLTPY